MNTAFQHLYTVDRKVMLYADVVQVSVDKKSAGIALKRCYGVSDVIQTDYEVAIVLFRWHGAEINEAAQLDYVRRVATHSFKELQFL